MGKVEDVEAGSIARRLDALIRLTLDEQLVRRALKRKDQLLILDSVGLSSGEIGQILGRSSKDIASDLRKLRTRRDKKTEMK